MLVVTVVFSVFLYCQHRIMLHKNKRFTLGKLGLKQSSDINKDSQRKTEHNCMLVSCNDNKNSSNCPLVQTTVLTIEELKAFLEQFSIDPESGYLLGQFTRTHLLGCHTVGTSGVLHRLQEYTLQPLGKLLIQRPANIHCHPIHCWHSVKERYVDSALTSINAHLPGVKKQGYP